MNNTISIIEILGMTLVITPWKIIGYVGVILFAGRWFVQLWASRRSRKVVMPRLFWYMSIAGSLMLLSYFIFGKNDSVGILSNSFPFLIASYNLYLDVTHKNRLSETDQVAGP
ncbi:MAG: lipid-A-disaccharide synthase N-terminal domain-containing protein [Pseudomonadota bacterium]|nr:lipid-A-disaccharide synthase N-terminal domain-containing protein [Pseudomonadota bacterium]